MHYYVILVIKMLVANSLMSDGVVLRLSLKTSRLRCSKSNKILMVWLEMIVNRLLSAGDKMESFS